MISLNYRDARPIYEQIRDGLRRLVVSGALAPGEQLPAVRELAAELAINPNTIQRAYRELEADGFIYTVPGKGSFAADREAVPFRRREELLERFDELGAELLFLGETPGTLSARLEAAARPGPAKHKGLSKHKPDSAKREGEVT